jgi:hypothetical protein
MSESGKLEGLMICNKCRNMRIDDNNFCKCTIHNTITIPISEWEAMRLDAERYRYVRENPIVCIERWENIPLPANEVDVAVDEAIKAIDAAIKEGN